jgi:hypothetical protein
MSRPRDRFHRPGVLPFAPLPGGELVLPQVVPVGQVRVGVDVPGVAAKYEHGGFVYDSTVVISVKTEQV